jgi:hypothetical protein
MFPGLGVQHRKSVVTVLPIAIEHAASEEERRELQLVHEHAATLLGPAKTFVSPGAK